MINHGTSRAVRGEAEKPPNVSIETNIRSCQSLLKATLTSESENTNPLKPPPARADIADTHHFCRPLQERGIPPFRESSRAVPRPVGMPSGNQWEVSESRPPQRADFLGERHPNVGSTSPQGPAQPSHWAPGRNCSQIDLSQNGGGSTNAGFLVVPLQHEQRLKRFGTQIQSCAVTRRSCHLARAWPRPRCPGNTGAAP